MTSLEENIKPIIQSLFRRCDAPFKIIPLDQDFYQQCVEGAVRRGYPMDGQQSMKTYLREGVEFVSHAFSHLDHATQIWVALYTSCIYFIDDTGSRPSERRDLYRFNERFTQRKPQANGVLNAFVDLLDELPQHFQSLPSCLITTSSMNFVTGTLLELETESMKVSSAAGQYPTYCRTMTGDAEAYALLIFPRDMPIHDYIQAIPEIATFINGANDTLSFYKEEKSGEATNRISLAAAHSNTSKLEALDAVAEMSAQSYLKVLKVLEESPAACGMFKRFATGFCTFVASFTDRYHFVDLQL